MNLVHYLRTLRRRWRIILAAAAIGAVVGLLIAPRPKTADPNDQKTVYLATQRFIANQSVPRNSAAAGLSLDQMQLLITQGDVPQRVAARLGGDAAEYSQRVHTTVNAQLRTFEISARGADPEETEQVADVFGEELLAAVRDLQAQRTGSELESTRAALDGLRAQYDAVVGTDDAANATRQKIAADISTAEATILELESATTGADPLTTLSQTPATPTTPAAIDRLFKTQNSQGRGATQALTAADVVGKSGGGSDGVSPILALVAGGMAGAVLAGAIVLIIAALDPRIFTKEQAEAAFGLPVVAEIPNFSRRQRRETDIVSRTAPYSRFAEAFRVLRSSIVFVERSQRSAATADHDRGSHTRNPNENRTRATVIMITSPGPSEGKTTTASNLAAVLAEDGSRVLVVNCDFRRPRLHLFLGTDHSARKVIDTDIPGVKFVAGVVDDHRMATPAEVVKAQRDVVNAASEVFDYIILDTAPLLTTNDASDVLPVTDMVVLVCRASKTTKEVADRAAELLERFNAPVIGVALVGAVDSPSAHYYYYYAADEEPEARSQRRDVNPLAALVGDEAGAGTSEDAGEASRSTDADADSAVDVDVDGDAEGNDEDTEVPGDAEVSVTATGERDAD